MSVWVSLQQEWIMTSSIKQTPTILARKPFAVLWPKKRKHPTRTANRFVISFTLNISSAALVLKCHFIFSRHFTVNHASTKEKSFHEVCPTSACQLDSLNVEVSELRPLSSNFVHLALNVACFRPFFGARFVKLI